jgi:hypothetical protein
MADLPDTPDEVTPIPTRQLDKDLQEVLDRSLKFLRRINVGMGVILLVVVVVASILVRQSWTEKSRVDDYLGGQCPFFYPVAVLPVPANTTKLGVDLVEGARTALARQACPEKIPPPSKELLALGRKYGIPIAY